MVYPIKRWLRCLIPFLQRAPWPIHPLKWKTAIQLTWAMSPAMVTMLAVLHALLAALLAKIKSHLRIQMSTSRNLPAYLVPNPSTKFAERLKSKVTMAKCPIMDLCPLLLRAPTTSLRSNSLLSWSRSSIPFLRLTSLSFGSNRLTLSRPVLLVALSRLFQMLYR